MKPREQVSAIEVTGLRKKYGDVQAVDGIDLSIGRGEVFAILGPNGAGKTTTVEILEGFRRADAGTVRVLGVDPATATRAWRAQLGIVLQESQDAPELTVREMVAEQASYYPAPCGTAEVLSAVGLTAQARQRIRHLSGGQRRRLDVALAIVGSPELIFLDEPTTGFDPQARHDFWDLIESLTLQGVTIVLTTHYLEEAARLADRLAVVSGGRIIALDTPAGLGGPARDLVRVAWREPDAGPQDVRTTQPTAVVEQLARRLGGEIPDLEVQRPTLEDIYLEMLTDTAQPSATTPQVVAPGASAGTASAAATATTPHDAATQESGR